MSKSKFFVAGSLMLLTLAISITACDKKVGKAPEPEPLPTINCDTITYTKYIKSIVDGNCALGGCHDGSNSNPDFRTYEVVKDRAEAGRIKARAFDESSSRMPPPSNPALTAAQKELLDCWLNNGKKQ